MIIPGAAIWLLSAQSEWSFGCVNSDGTLDEAKVIKYLKILKKNRALFLRQFPYLLEDETGHGQLRVGESAHLPFYYDGSRFDLSRLNPAHFACLRRLAELANEYGMAFAFCIADRCHGKAVVGPWYNNINGVHGWRDLNSFFRAYVRQVVTVLAGTRTYYIDENEPDGSDYLRYSDELFRLLEQLGVARSRMIAGGEFYHKDPLTQKAAIEAKGRAYRVDGLSTFHHFDDERWAYIFPRYQVFPAKTEGRRFFLSDDGLRLKRTKAQNLEFYRSKFAKMPNLSELECWIESCIAPYPGDTTPIETLCEAVGGIALAGGYELLPDEPEPVEPPVVPEPTPEPEKEEELQYTRLFGAFKKKFPFVNLRLWNWIQQVWNQSTVRHIASDAVVLAAMFAAVVWLLLLIF